MRRTNWGPHWGPILSECKLALVSLINLHHTADACSAELAGRALARGIKLGSPTIAATNRQAANRHAEALRDIVEPIKHLSTRRIAAVLNERGIETSRGGRWQPMTVARLLGRLGFTA